MEHRESKANAEAFSKLNKVLSASKRRFENFKRITSLNDFYIYDTGK